MQPAWADMFRLGLPVVEKIARPVIVYGFLVVAIRLFGKRELAQLNTFDFVVLLTVSNTVQNAIIGDDNTITGGVIGALTLFLVNSAVVRAIYRQPAIDRLIEGEPDVLMSGGRIHHKRLEKELITVAELERAAHKQGFGSLRDIDKAVLEPGGGFCFFGKQPPLDTRRHEELLARLDQLSVQLKTIRGTST
jgi:uncharacterized membrane protein YcaP (DUF421 family)